MFITLTWDTTPHIAFITFVGEPQSWDAVHAAIDEAYAEIKAYQDPISIIFISDEDVNFPLGNPLTHIRRALDNTPENVVLTMSIVKNRFVRRILRVALQIYLIDHHIVADEAEARAKIADIAVTDA